MGFDLLQYDLQITLKNVGTKCWHKMLPKSTNFHEYTTMGYDFS